MHNGYKLIKSASELYYFDYEGDKTIVKIENNNCVIFPLLRTLKSRVFI